MSEFLFLFFGGLALGAALLAVTRRNAVSAAVFLVVMFFGLAGCYVLQGAYFVAAVQVLVYAGAIIVLFLFVIMLLDLRQEMLAGRQPPLLKFFGLLGAFLFLVVSAFTVLEAERSGFFARRVPSATDPTAIEVLADKPLDGGAYAIAEELFTRWLLPFEVTSVLLLGAILGAVILTKRRLT